MNILLVNHLLDPVSGGGTAERTYQMARFLALDGESCTVLCLDTGLTPTRVAGLGSVRLRAVPCLNQRFFVPQIGPGEISRLVAETDLVYLSGHWTILNALVFRACRRLKTPYLFCPAGALKPFGRSFAIKNLYDRLVGQAIVQFATRCVAITPDECEEITARGVAREDIVVVPNGIDPDLYVLAEPERAVADFRRARSLGEAPYLLFLGRLNEIKGPDLLLEAFATVAARFPDLLLVLAGPDGGMQAALTARAGALGLSNRIRFAGFIAGRDKAAALRGTHLLVIPSRREAMSIVVLEAGACGCPVLFTDACGLADLAEAGAGTQVSVNAADLASGLGHLLEDQAGRTASARRLAAQVAENYLWRSQARRLVQIGRPPLREGRP